jgi:glutathione S-transferase
MLGDTLSAADILSGMALSWGLAFKLIPESPTISNYVARMTADPFRRCRGDGRRIGCGA